MKQILSLTLGILGLAALISLAGCQQNANKKNADDHHPAEEAHATEGPHHGSLIELGKEEYHAELVHDEKAAKVTIYILDGTAKKQVPIDAKEIVINLKHGEKGEQFTLKAVPDASDAKDKSSRFVSEEKELSEDLDAENANARLVVMIGGQPFTGEVKHDHDHEGGHTHKHE